MNKYIKPGASVLLAAGAGTGGSGCTTTKEDLELLADIYGITDLEKAFSLTENCVDGFPIEDYCKFTSVENGVAMKAFFS